MQEFNSEIEAQQWMYEEALLDENCIDNYRFAFQDDDMAVSNYNHNSANGCCGFFDEEIIVASRLAMIGCNFGH